MNFSEERKDIVYSGGFDPLHVDHLDRMYEAKQRSGTGSQLIVIVEPDSFIEKKHPCLMPQEERAQIIRNVKWVDRVYLATEKYTTADLLSILRPRAYMIGQDHDPEDIPERAVCAEHHIHIAQFKFGTAKSNPRSSSKILSNFCEKASLGSHSIAYKPKYDNPPVTVSAIITDGKYVLVGTRQDKQLDLPGGFLEVGEGLQECVVREVQEELGMDLADCEYYLSMPGKYVDGRDIVSVYFKATLRSNGRFRPSSEIRQVSWYESTPITMYSAIDRDALSFFFQGK